MNVKLVGIEKKMVAAYGSNGREKLKEATRRSQSKCLICILKFK